MRYPRFHSKPKKDPSEEVLREESETLSERYPTYGYSHITALLVRMGYFVGCRRVVPLMKAENLSVASQTHLNDYNIGDAREHIGHFLEQMYNQKRPHSVLENHLTPVEFEEKTWINFANLWSK